MNHLLPYRDQELSLADLVAAAAHLLAHTPASEDGRVAAAPDARTLRWYQSLGVMDRPLRYDGRTAVYGYRHLLQAVCVKVLQAHGHTVAQAQAALAGATTDQLEAAVAEALGTAAPPRTGPRPLVSVELAPGVVVTVDPAVVNDPDALVRALHLATTGALR